MPPPPTKTALLLPASPTTSISAATAFWAPTITSAYTRLPSTQYSLLYIAVPAPFPTASRRASFTAAQELFTALYSLINDLGNPQVDVRIVLLSAVDAAFGPVMGFEQLADLQEWDLLLCPRHDTGYQLQGQFLASSGSPSIRINYVDVGDFTPGGDVPEVVAAEELNEEELEEHAIVAGMLKPQAVDL